MSSPAFLPCEMTMPNKTSPVFQLSETSKLSSVVAISGM
jgi:hypothetical protein